MSIEKVLQKDFPAEWKSQNCFAWFHCFCPNFCPISIANGHTKTPAKSNFKNHFLTNLELHGIISSILDPDTLVMFVTTLSPSINEEPLLMHGTPLTHASRGIRLEIPLILENHGAILNMQMLPLSLSPIWQDTSTSGGALYRAVPQLGGPHRQGAWLHGESLVAVARGPQVIGAGRVGAQRHRDLARFVILLVHLRKSKRNFNGFCFIMGGDFLWGGVAFWILTAHLYLGRFSVSWMTPLEWWPGLEVAWVSMRAMYLWPSEPSQSPKQWKDISVREKISWLKQGTNS